MEPAKPPLPRPWNLPFQPAAGSQTSNWMLESGAGLMTPATRQKAGRLGRGLPPGGVKLPAETSSAVLMVVAGRLSLARASQGWAAREAAGMQAARDIAARAVRSLMVMGCVTSLRI